MLNDRVKKVTDDIIKRSEQTRAAYLARIDAAAGEGPNRTSLSCGNLAHGFAACNLDDKGDLTGAVKSNIAIISSYNDMLSAHQPFEAFPALIKAAVKKIWRRALNEFYYSIFKPFGGK